MMANILCYLWYLDIGEEPNSLGDWSKYQGTRTKLNSYRENILNNILSKDFLIKESYLIMNLSEF
ncbi:hypothetical protein BUZ97_13295 [Mammaliicoccus sciuri]|nr:hypothetical protein BUZ97_13295 [Mammaliicoccus sciuri]